MIMKKGNQLRDVDQVYVLAAYVHRFTKQHVPAWARHPRVDGKPYMPQFADDADWLANTEFAVTKSGRLDMRTNKCFSTPTWPEGAGD
jgi:hypothetical protein